MKESYDDAALTLPLSLRCGVDAPDDERLESAVTRFGSLALEPSLSSASRSRLTSFCSCNAALAFSSNRALSISGSLSASTIGLRMVHAINSRTTILTPGLRASLFGKMCSTTLTATFRRCSSSDILVSGLAISPTAGWRIPPL